ncbi:histone lysine demethylase JMJD4 [Cardiosporidium cionae]|uniref:Histone lysine demethylase JMJD4 n=1 Tax=Cardiosporidium cionae TaxID=476202 RepID=A0ABQ7J6F3_9APIC|nr:histone lysine demethylase JMJD4 [Cardiosporidium cionae]|eukprot:KAF8819540.1 histone lysine demethylase JMJD4 [Cardiosporidium cionae]
MPANYAIPHLPVAIQGISGKWPSQNEWIEGNSPNFATLRQLPNVLVPVNVMGFSSGNSPKVLDPNYEHATSCDVMTFHDFLDYWERRIKLSRLEKLEKNLFPIDSDKLKSFGKEICYEELIYLKDWHYSLDVLQGNLDPSYSIPSFFSDDWIDKFHLLKKEDYHFVYYGPAGSYTTYHMDVLGTHSWSTNLCGRKLWKFYVPDIKDEMKTSEKKASDSVSGEDTSLFQLLASLFPQKSFCIIQDPGEAVFVPSGWYHSVYNIDDCISINHNWLNGSNIIDVANVLKSDLFCVFRRIADDFNVGEKEIILQRKTVNKLGGRFLSCNYADYFVASNRVMEANCGISFVDFFSFLIRCLNGLLNKLYQFWDPKSEDTIMSVIMDSDKLFDVSFTLFSMLRIGILLHELFAMGYAMQTTENGYDSPIFLDEMIVLYHHAIQNIYDQKYRGCVNSEKRYGAH